MQACAASDSAKAFRSSINTMRNWNAAVDLLVLSAERHFDNEKILGGRELIRLGLEAVKANVKLENFDSARRKLGRTLHTLQVILMLFFKMS